MSREMQSEKENGDREPNCKKFMESNETTEGGESDEIGKHRSF